MTGQTVAGTCVTDEKRIMILVQQNDKKGNLALTKEMFVNLVKQQWADRYDLDLNGIKLSFGNWICRGVIRG